MHFPSEVAGFACERPAIVEAPTSAVVGRTTIGSVPIFERLTQPSEVSILMYGQPVPKQDGEAALAVHASAASTIATKRVRRMAISSRRRVVTLLPGRGRMQRRLRARFETPSLSCSVTNGRIEGTAADVCYGSMTSNRKLPGTAVK